MKRFNVTGICYPDKHYMVDISERLEIIAQMVERGDYFCINAGRQYGKTTTLNGTEALLSNDYLVLSLSFEGMSASQFATLESLGFAFMKELKSNFDFGITNHVPNEVVLYVQSVVNEAKSEKKLDPDDFSCHISQICKLLFWLWLLTVWFDLSPHTFSTNGERGCCHYLWPAQ